MGGRVDMNRGATSGLWRAGCAETCTSGSEGGPGKRTFRKVGTAPWVDPTGRRQAGGVGRFGYTSRHVELDLGMAWPELVPPRRSGESRAVKFGAMSSMSEQQRMHGDDVPVPDGGERGTKHWGSGLRRLRWVSQPDGIQTAAGDDWSGVVRPRPAGGYESEFTTADVIEAYPGPGGPERRRSSAGPGFVTVRWQRLTGSGWLAYLGAPSPKLGPRGKDSFVHSGRSSRRGDWASE